MKNLSQRATEASSRPVTPDRRKASLKVSLIDAVTLSDGEGRENARGAADRVVFWSPCAADLRRAEWIIGVSAGIRGGCLPVLWIGAWRRLSDDAGVRIC